MRKIMEPPAAATPNEMRDTYTGPWIARWTFRRGLPRKIEGRWIWRRIYGDLQLYYGRFYREWEPRSLTHKDNTNDR